MECKKDTLPSNLEFSLFGGNIQAYKEALYKIFVRDFINSTVFYNGKPVDIIHEKFFEGKERSFWHIISEGEKDIDRTPITWRSEPLPWVKPLIEEDGACSEYRRWIKYHDQSKKERHYIWCVAINYLVILEDRSSCYKLITAFPVMEYKVKYYLKEYEKHK